MPKINKEVFVNCPFDNDNKERMNIIIFTVFFCGYHPRTAIEVDNALGYRLDKISKLIVECEYAIHDMSMVGLDTVINLPRFNMPFECGLFYGISKFIKNKKGLILEGTKHDLHKCLSDLKGIDPKSHGYDDLQTIEKVRTWLNQFEKKHTIPSHTIIFNEYGNFKTNLPTYCSTLQLDHLTLDYFDLLDLISAHIKSKI